MENLKTAFVANRITSVKTSTTQETVQTREERKCRVVSQPPRSWGLFAPNVQFGGEGGYVSSPDMFKNSYGVWMTEEQKRQRLAGSNEQPMSQASQVDNKIYYQSQVVNIEHKREKRIPERTVALTPPLSSPAEDHSGSSQSTVVTKRQHVSVRERAKLLQQKVEEDYINQVMSQEESANDDAERNEAKEQTLRRAEEIPGAVRVLPPMPGGGGSGTPSGSRLGSAAHRRGSSVDSAGLSPLTVWRASPFSRRAESQPPPMFVPPAPSPLSPTRQQGKGKGWHRPMNHVGDSSRQKYESEVAVSATTSAVQSCTTSACSTLERAFLPSMGGTSPPPLPGLLQEGADRDHRRRTPVGVWAYDSEVDELTAPHDKRKPCRRAAQSPDHKMMQPGPAIKRARDGYEADTDDTLARRRGSVKEMARWIQACLIISHLDDLCRHSGIQDAQNGMSLWALNICMHVASQVACHRLPQCLTACADTCSPVTTSFCNSFVLSHEKNLHNFNDRDGFKCGP